MRKTTQRPLLPSGRWGFRAAGWFGTRQSYRSFCPAPRLAPQSRNRAVLRGAESALQAASARPGAPEAGARQAMTYAGFFRRVTFLNARSNAFGSSAASVSRAVSRNRLYSSGSRVFGLGTGLRGMTRKIAQERVDA